MPIRTVLLTGLAKYDGRRMRLLNTREFHQIAGRAGRAGFDTVGHVVVQAPTWTIEFERERAKQRLARSPGRPPQQRQEAQEGAEAAGPPEGAVSWSEQNLDRLVQNQPEALRPHLRITASMLLALISRPGSAVAAGRHLIFSSHQTPTQKLKLAREAIELLRGLRDADIVEILPEPDHLGRRIVLVEDLQLDFTMNQPLAPVRDRDDRLPR